MSIDKSLKMKGKLVRPRNVFTRVERIKILKGEGKWEPTMSVFGIPKVKSVKIKRKGKSEKKAAKAEAAAEATPAAAAATPAAAPAAGKEKAKK
ncbi:MAG: small basic protein [Planctomycetes bacterium]|uniref:small basic protein n=1 Tax=Candidatus Wunengus sp. YC65 TaxID=3367701 RepID=UPI001D2744D6|nr:small basic protein [Planctomycetota bacterium]